MPIIWLESTTGRPAGISSQGAQQNTQLGHMPRTPDGTRRQNRRDEKRQRGKPALPQRGKPALPQRATCVCSCSKSSRASTSNSSHSLETSMVRTYSACAFATKPPPLPRGRERSSSNAHEGKSTGAPGTPSKLVRQIRATLLTTALHPAASCFTAPATSDSAASHPESAASMQYPQRRKGRGCSRASERGRLRKPAWATRRCRPYSRRTRTPRRTAK